MFNFKLLSCEYNIDMLNLFATSYIFKHPEVLEQHYHSSEFMFMAG